MTGGNRLLVLTYHGIDTRRSVISTAPDLFHRQMEALTSHGLVGISLADAFGHYERTGCFPTSGVVLTFDDGYLSVLDQALPIMQSFGFRCTAFIIAGLVGLNAAQARNANRYIDRDLMGWTQLAELADCSAEIGSHTMNHPDLTKVDPHACERELSESRENLQQMLQLPVESFAYPFGCTNPSICAAAKLHYRRACTTRLGRNLAQPDPLQIQRVDVYYVRRLAMFRRLLEGGLDTYLQYRQALRDLKLFFR